MSHSIRPMTAEEYKKHLSQEHRMSTISTYIKEIVYGANDGIVTTFAVVAGFTGANSGSVANYTFLTVFLFGLANLLADGSAMGLGNFLSVRSDKKVYAIEKAKEAQEVQDHPSMEKAETEHILMSKGFTEDQARQLTEIYAQNPDYWIQFMMNYELEMANPSNENPLYTGLATFGAFLLFGSIPLLPFVLLASLTGAFFWSSSATLLALVLLGLLRWRVTKEKLLSSVGEIVLIGGTSAVIAFVVGLFFRT